MLEQISRRRELVMDVVLKRKGAESRARLIFEEAVAVAVLDGKKALQLGMQVKVAAVAEAKVAKWRRQ